MFKRYDSDKDFSEFFFCSYSFISTTVDKTQLCHRAKIKWDGDRTEQQQQQQQRPFNGLWSGTTRVGR